jgi:tetraacyldisaccharide 4'-kinase
MSAARAALERHLIDGWYGQRPLWWAVPLVPIYLAILLLRGAWLALVGAVRAGVPVVVVGNATVGGTGKTPLVAWTVEALRARGYAPAIVSRGHGGRSRRALLVGATSTAAEVGDEPLLLARRCGVPVVVGRDRVAAVALLREVHPEVDVVVSDDGLQHRRMAREAEVLVVDGARGTGNGWLLPAGPLREPFGPAAARAAAVVHNGRGPEGALVMTLEPGAVRQLADGAERPLAAFAGQRVRALAGIGNPERFFAMLERSGLEVERHPRPDHHPLTLAELPDAQHQPVLITEKDAIKLPAGAPAGVWCVPVAARFADDDAERLIAAIAEALPPPR